MNLFKGIIAVALIAGLCSFKFYQQHDNIAVEAGEVSFKQFLKEFKVQDARKPFYLLPHTEASSKNHENVLGAKYMAFIPEVGNEMISRLGPPTARPELALTKTNQDYVTLIYSLSREFTPFRKNYVMATYNHKGERLSKAYICSISKGQKVKVTINEDMSFVMKQGGGENLGKLQHYSISEEGVIEALDKSRVAPEKRDAKLKIRNS